jgi:hypothetical protein
MLLELYVFYEVLAIGLFIAAFFTHQEILWGLACVFAGILAFASYGIDTYVYSCSIDPTVSSTVPICKDILITNHYGYLKWINVMFLSLWIVLLLFDLFDKYGSGKGFKFLSH